MTLDAAAGLGVFGKFVGRMIVFIFNIIVFQVKLKK